ncbi:MAG: hypothetical protein ABI151_11445 [Chitinophagaceae bacterium]
MAAQEEQYKRINNKVQLLLKRLQLLQKENEKLKSGLRVLQLDQVSKVEELRILQLRTEALKATKTKLTEEERKSLEKKINQYVKEIDRCIALLKT